MMRRLRQRARLGVVAAASFVLLVLVLPQVATGIGLGSLAARITDSGACGSSGSGSSGSGSFVGGSGSGSGSSTCGPATLTASPNSALVDGQTISVTGSGFPPNSEVGLTECKLGAGLLGCALDSALELGTNGSGSFSTPFTVSRIIEISSKSGEVDKNFNCAPGRCFLGAAELFNYNPVATSPLNFNPRSPLALRGTVSTTGTVVTKTGVATISGTVTCLEPDTEVNVNVELQQIYRKRFNFTNEGYANVTCTGHTAWSVIVPPGIGLFGLGPATVQAEIQADIGTSYRYITVNRNVTLQAPPKN
jgi:Neocarzinostatin family